MRATATPDLQRETLRQIGRTLAAGYANQIQGDTVEERMKSLADLLSRRSAPLAEVQPSPCPKLAEQDSGIHSVEQATFS